MAGFAVMLLQWMKVDEMKSERWRPAEAVKMSLQYRYDRLTAT